MATSGLMLFARGAAVQRQLSMDFAARRIHKHYVALVHGRLAEGQGRIELPLAADWPRRPLQKVDLQHGKPSITDWQVLGFDAARHATRLALQPLRLGLRAGLRLHDVLRARQAAGADERVQVDLREQVALGMAAA